jgi:hypothetical protein
MTGAGLRTGSGGAIRLERKIQSRYRWCRHRSVQILFSLKIAARALLFIFDLAATPPSRIAPLRELLGSTPGNHS